MTKTLFIAAILLLISFATTAASTETPSGVATVTIECELYFKAGKQPQILDCSIVGLEPHQSSGE